MISNSDYRKYLDPSVIARLSGLELKARLVVEGFMTGLHKSPYHGFSVEFAEHRQYMPGDDLRHLDWKILARSERYYIKQYEEETNLKSYILLDISRSMSYSSGKNNESGSFFNKIFKKPKEETAKSTGLTKLEYSSYVAASLSYLMLMQNDAISLTTYDTRVRSYIPPRSTKSNLKLILKDIDSIKTENETGTAACLNEIASKINRRGLVIVISDLLDDPKSVVNALKHFRYKMNEVVVFQVLDPVEMNFIEGNPVTLVDLETREELFSQPFAMQKAYKEAMQEFIGHYKKEFRSNRIDYVLLSTETPFDKALLGYLNKRKKVM
ncbi:MAG TPA: DUF58 domain-containing protein [Ignavibacteria bacterium]|nr:DUF58 domain-containing protein [Ignavibacteria bacterium]